MTTMIPVPRLESGDRLTRDEFEWRYRAMSAHIKAELIEGVVYVASPVRVLQHGTRHNHVNTWVGVYSASTPGVLASDNATVYLAGANMPQPDVFVFIEPDAGGQAQITPDDYLDGAPELIIEIAASSVAYDMKDKLKAYERNGAQEYLVWQIYEQRFDWFMLQDGVYVPLPPDDDGISRSRVFPGLHLDIPALLRGDLARVLAVLNAGVQTPKHAAFVALLRERKQG